MESPNLFYLAVMDYVGKAASGWHYKLALSGPVAAYTHFFGGDAYVLLVFYTVFFLDLLVGVARSVKDGSFKPRRLCLWLVKLSTYGLCLGIVGALNGAAEHSWGVKLPLLDTVLVILTAGEAVSIFENLHGMGCQVPPVLFRLVTGVKTKAGRKLERLLDDDGGGDGQ
jgi:phage-related holin